MRAERVAANALIRTSSRVAVNGRLTARQQDADAGGDGSQTGSPRTRGESALTCASSGIASQSHLDRSSRREQSWCSMDPDQDRGDKMSPLLGESRTNHSMDRAVNDDPMGDLTFPIRRSPASIRRLNQVVPDASRQLG
jgi:hypothetical protein